VKYPRDKKGKRYVQVMNPQTKCYSVIDKLDNKVIRTRKSALFPYEGIKIETGDSFVRG
jgi:hypothetical protein